MKYLSLTGNLEPVFRAETGLVGVVAASTLTECRVRGDGRCWSIVDRGGHPGKSVRRLGLWHKKVQLAGG